MSQRTRTDGPPVAQADGQRAGAQRLRRYLARRITSGIKKGFQPRRQRGVVHLHIELEVQAQLRASQLAEPRQHRWPSISISLLWSNGPAVRRCATGPAPAGGARGPLHRGMVAVCGRQHLDAHAAQRGRAQRRDHRLIGHEVGVRMRECLPRSKRLAKVQRICPGPHRDGLDAARPRGSLLISCCGRFAPKPLLSRSSVVSPIIGEAPHQMLYHQPAQTKVQIVTGLAAHRAANTC